MKPKKITILLILLLILCLFTTSGYAFTFKTIIPQRTNEESLEGSAFGRPRSRVRNEEYLDGNGNHVYKTTKEAYDRGGRVIKVESVQSINSPTDKLLEQTRSSVAYTYDIRKGYLRRASGGSKSECYQYNEKDELVQSTKFNYKDTYEIKNNKAILVGHKGVGEVYKHECDINGKAVVTKYASEETNLSYRDFIAIKGDYKAQTKIEESKIVFEEKVGNINLFQQTHVETKLNYDANSGKLVNANYILNNSTGSGFTRFGTGECLNYLMTLDSSSYIEINDGDIVREAMAWRLSIVP